MKVHITVERSDNSRSNQGIFRRCGPGVSAACVAGLRGVLFLATALMAHSIAAQNLPPDQDSASVAAESLDAPAPPGIRPGGTIAQEFQSPFIPPAVKSMQRPARNYPEQPPVVPHSIRGYQINGNFNRCLTCHSRSATALTGAPMISVTHFLDRDSQVLAAVAPRRYFCLQCHVPQQEITPIKPNTFKGIDEVLHEIIVERESKK